MDRESIQKIMVSEGLSNFNFFEAKKLEAEEIVIQSEEGRWLVFSTGERANTDGTVSIFSNESDALSEFLERLRAHKRFLSCGY